MLLWCCALRRAHVLVLLPKLNVLDGRPVTPEELAKAQTTVYQENSTIAVMVGNACLVHKLSHTAQLLALHSELRSAVFSSAVAGHAAARAMLPYHVPNDLLRFLSLWEYERSLSHEVRQCMRAAVATAAPACTLAPCRASRAG